LSQVGDASVGAAVDRELLAAVVSAIHDALGGDPLGLYVFGSATLGRLRPASDLDLLAVVERPTTRTQKEVLARSLLAISGRRLGAKRGRPVELTCVVSAEVRPWRYPPIMDFQYGDWLRSDFERDEESVWQPSPNGDLAVLVAMTLRSGRAVLGPPAKELFDPVPVADVERSIIDSLPRLRAELDSDTRNVVLTLARGWMTVVTGEIRSKDATAKWALGRLPPQHRLPLARARDLYVTGGGEDWPEITHASIAAYADYVIGRIRASARTRRGFR
jgi:streptomycin 3"-adenylyltransferase